MNSVFCKYSNDRDRKFQIKTLIKKDTSGDKYVVKCATNPDATEHIDRILENYNKMQESFKNSIFKANKCAKTDEGIKLEYVEGDTLEDYLDSLYSEGNYIELVEKIKEFKDLLYSLESNTDFKYTDDFEKVFGKNGIFSNSKSLAVSNIDLIFGNIILGESWTIIDYEWSFDFPVPIEFILCRAIYYYVHGNSKRDKLIEFNIFEMLGITESMKKAFEEMERNFQEYVAGDSVTLSKLKSTMLKRKENVISTDDRKIGTDFVQVYFNYGNGYEEEKSVISYYNYTEDIVGISLDIDKTVEGLRVDPATKPAIISRFTLKANGVNKKYNSHNGLEFSDNMILFGTDDPQIEYGEIKENSKIEISFSISEIKHDFYDEFCDEFNKRITEKNNLTEKNKSLAEDNLDLNNEYKKLSDELSNVTDQKNRLEEMYNNLAVENNQRAQYIHNLHSKKVWRVLSISKRTLKSIKNVGLINTSVKGCKKVKNKLKNKRVRNNTVEVKTNPVVVNRRVSNKEKILVVVHEAQKAGATLLSMNIIKTIKAVTDYEPVILLLAGGPLTEEFKKQGICYELNQPDFSKIYDEQYLNVVIREIAGLGVKYALCNSVVTGLVLKELNKRSIKTITMVHEMPTSIFAYNFVEASKNVQKYSDDIVFAADFVRDRFVEHFPVNEKKCHIIPQGVYAKFNSNSINDKKANKKKLCKELGIGEDSKIILGCGYGNFRKGLDWFGLIAINEMLKNEETHFVWLGNRDNEFYQWINSDLLVNKLSSRFHWFNFVENPGYIFGGSDIFLLTSREDPFPSVALDAMVQYTPVIAFENAGGIPEILTDNRGINVPYGDCSECVNAIDNLLKDTSKYNEVANNAKKYISNITPENYINNLLEVLVTGEIKRKAMPDLKVSVVIPNYNYEGYIPERLSCILNQTVKPYEILFLDDVSKDNSVKVAEEILESSGFNYKIIANETNQGCFKQWLNGVENASGDIIWIAEADDVCELDFIERLLPFFEDEQVNIAYGQSEVINEFGEHSGFIYTEYTNDLSASKWKKDYVNNGEAEIIDGLGIKNTIPNASGVLMRKSAFEGIKEQLSKYAISGDWFTYVYLIKTGKIAFCSDILNYHRRHSTSIIQKREQDIKLFIELMNIKLFMAENFMIPESIKDRFVSHIRNEYGRLMSDSAPSFNEQPELIELQKKVEAVINDKISKYKFLRNVPKKNILFVIPDFEMGGGQTLVVRLANYFSKFHNTFVYNARPWLSEERIVKMLSEKVTILESHGDYAELQNYIKELKIDVINNHIWWADKISYKAAKDLDTKIVLSMHGCYEALLQHPDWDVEFNELAPQILNRADEIIYATDKNKKIFETVSVNEKIHQIYYGYELESIPKKDRSSLNIDEDSFVFGLVARGIKEKGFGEAVSAFKKLKADTNRKMDLVLIGNGEYIDELKKANQNEANIHFVDNLKKPSEWIGWVKNFDCALLPTYFVSESLPNAVIEYLAYSVPVISTNIGDIRYMIKNDKANAGIVLELHDGMVDVDELSDAMNIMLNDKKRYSEFKTGTLELFSQFDIKNFSENYYTLYV